MAKRRDGAYDNPLASTKDEDSQNRPTTPPPSYSSAVGDNNGETAPHSDQSVSSREHPTANADPAQTTNVTKGGHVEVTIEAPLKPPNYLFLSLVSCLFCNVCCGIAALHQSSQCDHYYKHGLYFEAEKYSETARQFSIMSMIVGSVIGVLSMGLVIWYLVTVQHAGTY